MNFSKFPLNASSEAKLLLL